jgi:hypothetical protein
VECRNDQLDFGAQAEAALEQAKLLLKDRLFRIDVVTKPGEFSLDKATPDKTAQLMNLGRGEAVKRETLETVKMRFIAAPKAPHSYPSTLCENPPACCAGCTIWASAINEPPAKSPVARVTIDRNDPR